MVFRAEFDRLLADEPARRAFRMCPAVGECQFFVVEQRAAKFDPVAIGSANANLLSNHSPCLRSVIAGENLQLASKGRSL